MHDVGLSDMKTSAVAVTPNKYRLVLDGINTLHLTQTHCAMLDLSQAQQPTRLQLTWINSQTWLFGYSARAASGSDGADTVQTLNTVDNEHRKQMIERAKQQNYKIDQNQDDSYSVPAIAQ
jgi:adenylate cyclase